MRNVWVAFFILSGLLLIPTTPASAAGVFSTVTKSVEEITGKKVNESSKEQREEAKKSIVGETVSKVVEVTDSAVEPVVETVEKVVPEADLDLGAAKVSTSSEGQTITTPVAEVKASSKEGVAVGTAVVDAKASTDEGVMVDSSVADVNATEDLDVKVETPVAKVETSVEDGVKIKTPVAKVETSLQEGIKVDTVVADVEVTDSLDVKVETPAVDADVSVKQPKVDVETKPIRSIKSEEIVPSQESGLSTPDDSVEVERTVEATPVTNENITQQNVLKHSKKIRPMTGVNQQVKAWVKPQDEQVKETQPTFTTEQPEAPISEPIPVQATFKQDVSTPPTSPSTTTTGQASGSASPFGGSAVFGVLFSSGDIDSLDDMVTVSTVVTYYDQWLNAPPSQPPKKPSFFAAY